MKRELVDTYVNSDGQTFSGLTKREMFAAYAMQGLLSAIYSTKEMLNEFTTDENGFRRHLTGCEAISRCAVNYADALLKKLEIDNGI